MVKLASFLLFAAVVEEETERAQNGKTVQRR